MDGFAKQESGCSSQKSVGCETIEWLKKELENGKLCARGTAVFAFHSLCDEVLSAENNGDSVLGETLPTAVRVLERSVVRVNDRETNCSGELCIPRRGNTTSTS